MCTLCAVTAQLSHCRCRKHLSQLARRHSQGASKRMRWASKYHWESEEATQYWDKVLGSKDAAWADAGSAAGS
eukprot:7029792-Lingulodinium_polyedra.AAC.1